MQLDTGSTYTSVPDLVLKDIPGNHVPISSFSRSSASGVPSVAEKVSVQKFCIGTVNIPNAEIVKYDASKNPIGRLGMNFLASRKLYFDFQTRLMHVDNDIYSASSLSNELELYTSNLFGIELEIKGARLKGLWDTGAELSIVNQELIAKYPKNFQYIQDINNGLDATGNKIAFKLYRSQLKILNNHFDVTVMSMNFYMIHKKISNKLDVILGTNIIRQSSWDFDLQNKKWNLFKT